VIPEDLQKLEVSPKQIYFIVEPDTIEPNELIRKVYVRQSGTGSVPPFRVDTRNCPPWLDARIVDQPLNTTSGQISVKLMPQALKDQAAGAQFSIFTDQDKEPIMVSVHVSKRRSYSISKSVVVFNNTTNDQQQSILFNPDGISSKSVKILDVSQQNPVLKTAFNNLADGTSTLQLAHSSDSLEKGTYKIRVTVRLDTGEQATETIHVLVMK
jgi:hypothetical protein